MILFAMIFGAFSYFAVENQIQHDRCAEFSFIGPECQRARLLREYASTYDARGWKK